MPRGRVAIGLKAQYGLAIDMVAINSTGDVMADFIRVPVALSVVVPCYNEESVFTEFMRRMEPACRAAVGESFEIIVVNDGSADNTWQLIAERAETSPQLVGINLSRNHGHQLAVSAGLSFARGERILIIDADLQDPPELLGEMFKIMDAGADVVYGQRRSRAGENQFKLATARYFYRILKSITHVEIPADAGDFRLINRRTLDLLNQMPEQQRYLRGMVAWLGGKQVPLPYDRASRHAGETKYTLRKMIRFAIDGITGFSAAPLKLATFFAMFAGLLSVVFGLYALYAHFFLQAVPGWTSLIGVILFFSSIQLLSLGIIGEYLGRVYMESKGRPLFLIQEIVQTTAPTVSTSPTKVSPATARPDSMTAAK